jgi:ribose transport system substrate-binding protein
VRGARGLVLCVLAGSLLACAERASRYVFALVPKAMNNPFFDQAREGCKAAEREIPEVECLYIGPGEHAEEEQVRIVEDLVTRGVDGIAVSPSNAPAIARSLERALSAGIPAITFDSDLLLADRRLRVTYVGTENYEIGVAQAKVLARFKPGGGTLCIQSGGPAASNHNERMQGMRDTLSGRRSSAPPGERLAGEGGWREVEGCPLYSNDDLPLSVSQMADVLGKYLELDAFVVTGGFPQFVEAAYRQVAVAHAGRLRSGRTILIAADTLPMQMAILRDGLSHAQIGQRPFEMGYRAMRVLKQIREGEPVSDPIYTGLDVCVAENADTCLSAH